MKKTVSKKKEKIRDKILDCEFSQKEFFFLEKNILVLLAGLIKQNCRMLFLSWQKSHFATSLPMFLVFYSFLFQV